LLKLTQNNKIFLQVKWIICVYMRKFLIILTLAVFLLSGCLLRNNTKDIIKVTSGNLLETKLNKVNNISVLQKTGSCKSLKQCKTVENYVNYAFKNNDASKNPEIRNELNKIALPIVGNDVIGRISLADRADVIKNSAIGIMQAFSPETPIIFASVEVINAKKPKLIKIKWNFISTKGKIIPVNSSNFNVSGSKTILLSIKSPFTGWPIGNYEMQVFVNGIKNSSLKFYIF